MGSLEMPLLPGYYPMARRSQKKTPMLPHQYLMMALIQWLSCRIQYMFLALIPRPLGWLDPILDRMRMIRLGVYLLIRTPRYTSFRRRWILTVRNYLV